MNETTRRCSAFCTATNYSIEKITSELGRENIPTTHYRSSNVLHGRLGSNGDLFYFAYGVVVLWGLSKSEEDEVRKSLKGAEDEPLDAIEAEESTYTLGHFAKIYKDEIVLPADDILTKLAMSHGLAQSVKLAVFEKRIDRIIAETKYIPVSMARTGKLPLSQNATVRMIGRLFLERNLVNLTTDILDTPEFFWEHSELEPLYRLISQDLDISARVNVLNKRVDIVKELFEMLENQMHQRHSVRLERIIVMLIFFEIILEISAILILDVFKMF